MAYNYQTPYQPTYYQQPQQNNTLIWVQGEGAARSFLTAPNTTLALWDSEKTVVYIKTTDASGMPSLKILDYTVRGQEASASPLNGSEAYATKADINTLTNELNALKSQITALSAKGEVKHEPAV